MYKLAILTRGIGPPRVVAGVFEIGDAGLSAHALSRSICAHQFGGLSRAKVDRFVPHTEHDNLRKVRVAGVSQGGDPRVPADAVESQDLDPLKHPQGPPARERVLYGQPTGPNPLYHHGDRWTGLAPWEFEFPFPGSLTSNFLVKEGNYVPLLRE